jgi:deoxyribose-phosphate aldolase
MTPSWTREKLAATIDHSLLKAMATSDQIVKLCREARQYGFAAVCINPFYVPLAVKELKGSKVTTCTVIGFPLGAGAFETKAQEAKLAAGRGAGELDMVMNIGALKSGHKDAVAEDIRQVVAAAGGAAVKVIIEACYLTEPEKALACELAMAAGAHYVKTSTGFGTGGATVSDVRLMRSVVGSKLGIKAAGGIGSLAEAVAMLEAGADRIGASAGVKIVNDINL